MDTCVLMVDPRLHAKVAPYGTICNPTMTLHHVGIKPMYCDCKQIRFLLGIGTFVMPDACCIPDFFQMTKRRRYAIKC